MSFKMLFVYFLLISASGVCAKGIAFSFDDGFNTRKQTRAEEWNNSILGSLSKVNLKAIFYVSGKFVDTPQGWSLVNDWSDNGHQIANHGYSHYNLNSKKISLDDYISDAEKNEKLLNNIPGWTKRYRFPYLKAGNTLEKRDGFRRWMLQNNYKTGAVSIDASDWYYNQRYLKLVEKDASEKIVVLKKAYLNHLIERAEYYDGLSNDIYSRSANHVLLLHTNAINAAFLSDILKMFRSKEWLLLDIDEAYNDPIYLCLADVLPAGESILWSQAKQHGIKNLRYPAEDSVYEKPVLDALGL